MEYIDNEGREYLKNKRGNVLYAKPCKYCGDKYFPNRTNQLYCSRSCGVKAPLARTKHRYKTEYEVQKDLKGFPVFKPDARKEPRGSCY